MKHHRNTTKFRRERDQRAVFVNSLAEALITRERIMTTETRAKVVRSYVETLVTKGKSGTVAARRGILASLGGRAKAARKVIDVLSPRFKDRKGGYTRITKVAKRSADGRQNAIIEFV